MSDITPRPNCACLPVTSSEVTTRTRVTASCSLMLTSTVADAVPVPRVSRPLPSSTKRGAAVDPLHGREIVTSLQQANAPDAVPDYVVPGASLGYTPGYDEAFQVTPSSADGNPVRFEVTIICAIRDGYAICAYAV